MILRNVRKKVWYFFYFFESKMYGRGRLLADVMMMVMMIFNMSPKT